jgi:Transglycosylase SLT domain
MERETFNRRTGLARTALAGVAAAALAVPTVALLAVTLALGLAAPASAEENNSGTTTSTSSSATASETTTDTSTTTSTSVSEGQSTSGSSTSTESSASTATASGSPEVGAQTPQPGSEGGARGGPQARGPAHRRRKGSRVGHHPSKSHGRKPQSRKTSTGTALPPGAAGRNGLAPLPFGLRTPVSGLPSLFLEAYDVPPFLLPIYQAAGIAYGVPWQVLAAINEVESDYGRDLNVSSAGAEGWMQFLPVEWRQWGVDAGEAGYIDPYNPADAIFAAARYLSAAGGAAHIRAAVFAYNHSQAYVESVMLRAKLLGDMPPEMLGAVTDLAEARFPVHAAAHFGDGFTAAPAGVAAGSTIVGTTIYSEPGAPAIAVKDGTVVAIGDSPALGLHVSLRDAYGDVFTYADLGEVASVYPVLAPRERRDGALAAFARRPAPRPSGPATAGVQPHSPLSLAAVRSGFAFGPIAALQRPSAPSRRLRVATAVRRDRSAAPSTRSFLEGPERVYLRDLAPGTQVIAGTVLGHLATGAGAHMIFQVRPAGLRSPLIDPKPLLDSWVSLEDTGVFGAKGEDPFLSVSPTAGQALLESRGQLQQQVLRDRGIGLPACARAEVEAGRVDRRVLATLELLAVSGLRPTVTHLRCGGPGHAGLDGEGSGRAFDVSAVNGMPVAAHAGPGGVADLLERRLLDLQGTMKPAQVAGPVAYLASHTAVSLPASRTLVHVAFAPPRGPTGAAAQVASAGVELAGSDWIALDERLAQIPDPNVPQSRSAAALPDPASAAGRGEAG